MRSGASQRAIMRNRTTSRCRGRSPTEAADVQQSLGPRLLLFLHCGCSVRTCQNQVRKGFLGSKRFKSSGFGSRDKRDSWELPACEVCQVRQFPPPMLSLLLRALQYEPTSRHEQPSSRAHPILVLSFRLAEASHCIRRTARASQALHIDTSWTCFHHLLNKLSSSTTCSSFRNQRFLRLF